MIEFPVLTAEDIDVRVATVTPNGLSLLLYKDARCDMRILDMTVGQENWQREHYECKGNLFCRVGICCDGEWIWKSDCGSESRTEAEKGEASDSFKRACFNWGIGRELYTAPFIWIPMEDKSGQTNYRLNDKKQPVIRPKVTFMRVENHKITALNIENSGRTIFTFGSVLDVKQPKKLDSVRVRSLLNELNRTGWNQKDMLEYLSGKFEHTISSVEALSESEYVFIMRGLEKKESAK